MREQSQVVRDLGDVQHAASEKRHFPSVFRGQIQNLLQAVDGGAEAGNHHAARSADEQVFETRTHRAFAFGVAGTVHVGRIRQQQKHAALAVFRQRVQVEKVIVGGRGIDFEVAGVNDNAQRSGDGQRHASSRWNG